MSCEHEENLNLIHHHLHVFEQALKNQMLRTSKAEEMAALDKSLEDLFEALPKNVPKYRLGLILYCALLAACDLSIEEGVAAKDAEKHLSRYGSN